MYVKASTKYGKEIKEKTRKIDEIKRREIQQEPGTSVA